MTTRIRRFWNKVDIKSGRECWEWLGGSRNAFGYGKFSYGNSGGYAHRAAWIMVYGEIPDDMHVLHHCDNPPCCNPQHLWIGTHQDNMKDRDRKGRGLKRVGLTTESQIKTQERKHGNQKLAESDVQIIRRIYFIGGATAIRLAIGFSITESAIFAIVARRAWQYVDDINPLGDTVMHNVHLAQSEAAKRTSKQRLCPGCRRKNGLGKPIVDDLGFVRKCRFCGFEIVFDRYSRTFIDG